jgi:hypothetical protein
MLWEGPDGGLSKRHPVISRRLPSRERRRRVRNMEKGSRMRKGEVRMKDEG